MALFDTSGMGTPIDPTMAIPNTPNYINPNYATPLQQQELYAYANELLKPQPINNGWQGLASLARALMGGYMGHVANLQGQNAAQLSAQQLAKTQGTIDSPSGTVPASSPVAPTSAPASAPTSAPSLPIMASNAGTVGGVAMPSAGNANPAAVKTYIAQAAAKRDIDPNTAVAMFSGESSLDPNAKGDGNSSFGVAQLHYGGISKQFPNPGLGDAFTKTTGLDARDPNNWQAEVDYALDQAKANGWGPWANTRDKLGIGNYTGIGQGAPATMPSGPIRVAQAAPNGLPVSASDIGAVMANPWIPQAQKELVQGLLAPGTVKDANGNVYVYHQFQPPQGGAPFFVGGSNRPISVEPGGGISTQETVAGPLTNPTAVIPGIGGTPPAGAGPATPLGSIGALSRASNKLGIENTADTASATAGVKQMNADKAVASNYQNQVMPYIKALPLIEKLGDRQTGPGTPEFNQLIQEVNEALGTHIASDDTNAYAEATKYLYQALSNNPAISSDERQALFGHATPNMEMPREAVLSTIKSALGQINFNTAKVRNYNGNGSDYQDYSVKWNQNYDPRAFQFAYMTPDEQRSMIASLPRGSAERTKFINSLHAAQAAGMYQMPGAQ